MYNINNNYNNYHENNIKKIITEFFNYYTCSKKLLIQKKLSIGRVVGNKFFTKKNSVIGDAKVHVFRIL